MIDTKELLDGLKECYEEHENINKFYATILWNIAMGNWDIEKEIESKEESRTAISCYNCKYIINANGNVYCPIRGYIKDIIASDCNYFNNKKNPKFNPSPDRHWCFCCTHVTGITENYCNLHHKRVDGCDACEQWKCVEKYS